ncbi:MULTISPECIES: hypothetical protein [Streptomyces]|uniref:hypothetical protein n=1 Tax=Streptomyces TaxID=1883 RepID=UPI0016702D04|nr:MULTISPECIES: hypothetical protein [Streptomyces]UFR00764.1 hypothetical protein KBP30_06055 [Streptomyces sp. Go40/10]GGS69826.1 hypothetical protein GCM10010206_35150 [Streptomyces cinerochromogenes]
MRLTRDGQHMSLHFPTGVQLQVDLSRLEMTDEQERSLNKLVELSGELAEECRDDDNECPAQAVLEPDEFEAVRQLKVHLQPADTSADRLAASGPIVDFCLHVVRVPR